MNENARRWRTPATSVAAVTVGVFMFAGAPASAQPAQPLPPQPGPSVVSQAAATPNAALTVPAAPQTALPGPATAGTPAAAAGPNGVGTPQVGAPAQVAITPATAGTLYDFFRDKGVALEPQVAKDFKALNIVLPMPQGWAHVPDPNVADAFAVIADRVGGNGLYSSNAQVVVYKLVGEFDPREAISHGFVDSQQLPAWRSTNGSMGEVGGLPVATIEGTYRENSMTLDTSRRHVIAANGPDRYLVSLAVTTSVDQVVAAGPATDAIVNGFKVSVPTPPGATPPGATPAAPPTPAAAAAPAPTASPSTLGAHGAQGAQAQPTIGLSG